MGIGIAEMLIGVHQVGLVAVTSGELPEGSQLGWCVLVRVQALTANGHLDDLELGTGRSERRPRLS